MPTLTEVKAALRVTTTAMDTEIQSLIDACKSDLEQSGVEKIVETDYLVKLAIITYCKSNFGFDNTDADRLNECYISIRNKLALAGDYSRYKVTFTVTHSGVVQRDATVTIGETILTTNSKGVAIYETLEKDIDVDYSVYYEGATVEGSVYVDADESVAVAI